MNEDKATRYQRRRRRADVWAWAIGGSLLSAVAFTPLGVWLRDWAWRQASALPPSLTPAGAVVVSTVALVCLWEVSTAAVVARALRSTSATAGRRDPVTASALMGQIGEFAVVLAVALWGAVVVLAAASVAGRWWWCVAGAGCAATWFAALELGPQVLARLARVQPVSRPALARTIAAVAEVARVPVAGVSEWLVGPGSRASALIAGLGRGRRVLVASALVRDWSDDEVAVVVAHELGHVARHDLARAVALNSIILTLGLGASAVVIDLWGARLGLAGPADLAALPVVVVVTGASWVVGTPVRHAQSRRQERYADAFALECTGEAGAFASALRRLSAERQVDERPSMVSTWLFHGHPSVAQRIEAAERFLSANEGAKRAR